MRSIVERHVRQSLDEMREPSKASQWANGTRAQTQAEEIASAIVAGALHRLETGEQGNAVE